MKTGLKRKSTLSSITFKKMKFDFEANYKEYRDVISRVNKLRASEIVESELGHILPNNLGKIIILKRKPKITKLFSSTTGKRLYNMHSFGYIYKVHHKDRFLLRYPELYKFRPNRPNIKRPLNEYAHTQEKSYYDYSDYIN